MRLPRLNWALWAGFLLSFLALLSYPFFFVQFPITRDFPWATLLLFVVAAVILFVGIRRAFAAGRPRPTLSKITAVVLTLVSVISLGLFVFGIFIAARWLPASHGAPQVGAKAPDFTLVDTTNKQVSLSELLSTPINKSAAPPKGVLLIFYRGYW
jgi:hypothetical protein